MNGHITTTTILVVEDDEFVQQLLCAVLESAGYRTCRAGSMQALKQQLERSPIDAMLLDLGLPDGDGLDALKHLRANKNPLPIVVLTSRTDIDTRIEGLEAGADDYVTKPVEPKELLLRIRRLVSTQHSNSSEDESINLGNWTLSLSRRSIDHNQKGGFALTRSEFDLLAALFQAPDRVLNREQLLNALDRTDSSGYDRTVDVLISRLRKKLKIGEDRFSAIETVQGIGYKLVRSQLST